MIDQDAFVFHLERSLLRQIREALKLSQKELAEKIGVTRNTISRWEVAERTTTLTLDQVIELDKLLAEIGLRFSDLPAPTFAAPAKAKAAPKS